MDRLLYIRQNLNRRKNRTRANIFGASERPRLTVHISNKNITAQIIDDVQHSTLAYATTTGQKDQAGTMVDKAAWVGTEIAKKAKGAKIKKVVFDRGGRIYHGRIKALADAARSAGLEF